MTCQLPTNLLRAATRFPLSLRLRPIATLVLGCTAFLLLSGCYFLALGQPPLKMLTMLWAFSLGDGYSLAQTFAKTTPILLCALAAAIPGRLGLISVGAEGQLHAGAISGTAVVLVGSNLSAPLSLLLMLAAAALGGAIYGYLPGLLRTRLTINETISTLLLNYVAILWVNALVYGPWRDPAAQGWPATKAFPPAAVIPKFTGTDVHLGIVLGVVLALALHVFFTRGRFAMRIRILAGNRKVGQMFGLSFSFWALCLMALGGAVAGLAGICETSAVQGRLQPSLSVGYGLTGFLVAWMARHRPLVIVPVAFAVGALMAGSDALQLFAKVPAASAVILQGLLFLVALLIPQLDRVLWRSRGV